LDIASRFELPLLGSNQDSPDPEGLSLQAEIQQLAVLPCELVAPVLDFKLSSVRSCGIETDRLLMFSWTSHCLRAFVVCSDTWY
jgi:hypothetical protein